VHCESRVAMAVARMQFGNPKEGERSSSVGSRYQRAGEGTADQEDSVLAVVKCRVLELAIAQ
jgi:hypothetical protein